MEQANYTNKYLQVLGEKLISPKTELLKIGSSLGQASTSKQLEKPLFKTFKISQKAKQNLLKAKATSDQNHGELLNKINNLLTTVVPDTPQPTEETSSKLKIRQPTKMLNKIDLYSDRFSNKSKYYRFTIVLDRDSCFRYSKGSNVLIKGVPKITSFFRSLTSKNGVSIQ